MKPLFSIPNTAGSAAHHVVKVYDVGGDILVMTLCDKIASAKGTTKTPPVSGECAMCFNRSQGLGVPA